MASVLPIEAPFKRRDWCLTSRKRLGGLLAAKLARTFRDQDLRCCRTTFKGISYAPLHLNCPHCGTDGYSEKHFMSPLLPERLGRVVCIVATVPQKANHCGANTNLAKFLR